MTWHNDTELTGASFEFSIAGEIFTVEITMGESWYWGIKKGAIPLYEEREAKHTKFINKTRAKAVLHRFLIENL